MKTKTYIFSLLGSALLVVGLTSCHSVLDDKEAEVDKMEFNTSINTASTTTSKATSYDTSSIVPGIVYMWPETDNSGNNYSFSNFQYNFTFEDLKAYTTDKFSTGKAYPDNDIKMNAVGYSPATGLALSNSNQTLSIEKLADCGTTDVLTSNIIQGSASSPFNQIMEFKHALTKVTFIVKYDATFAASYALDKVFLTIPAKYLPKSFAWNVADNKWEANVVSNTSYTASIEKGLSEVNHEYNIGSYYLMVNSNDGGNAVGGLLSDLVLKINRETADNRLKPGESPIFSSLQWTFATGSTDTTGPIQLFKDEAGTIKDTTPQAGNAYKIIFTLSNDTFKLVAKAVDWYEGGLITIPIKP